VIDESAGPVSLSVAFNSDSSCFSVGLDTGFCGKLGLIPIERTFYFEMFPSRVNNNVETIYIVFTTDPCELKVSRGEWTSSVTSLPCPSSNRGAITDNIPWPLCRFQCRNRCRRNARSVELPRYRRWRQTTQISTKQGT
jgi:hypothetical protein